MTVPRIVELESGAIVFIRAVNGKVFLQAPPGATLTRAEAEAVADALCLAGMDAEPPKSLQGLPRAKPITSVDDERVKGAP